MNARGKKANPPSEVIECDLWDHAWSITAADKRSTARIFARWAEMVRRAADLEEGVLPEGANN